MEERTETRTDGSGSYAEGPAALAYRALLEHTQVCEQCVEDSRECPTGRALVRTLREARSA
jgi:hypothetical protein